MHGHVLSQPADELEIGASLAVDAFLQSSNRVSVSTAWSCREAAGSVVAQWGWPAPELASPLDPHQPSPPHASPLPAAWHEPEATQQLLAALQRAMLPPMLDEDASAAGASRNGHDHVALLPLESCCRLSAVHVCLLSKLILSMLILSQKP